MDDLHKKKLIEAYIARFGSKKQMLPPDDMSIDLPDVSGEDVGFWAYQELQEFVDNNPQFALDLVCDILANTEDPDVISMLGASAVEDLIHYHGRVVIDRIEVLSKSDKRFQELLKHVWESGLPDVWERIKILQEG